MNADDARLLARAIKTFMPMADEKRLKAIHIDQKLHRGHLTIRCFFVNQTAEDPAPYIFKSEEL